MVYALGRVNDLSMFSGFTDDLAPSGHGCLLPIRPVSQKANKLAL